MYIFCISIYSGSALRNPFTLHTLLVLSSIYYILHCFRVVLLKKFITWYYKREIVHGKDKLADLKAKKKKILDDVMNKETYKVAKDILEKYAPEQLRKNTVRIIYYLLFIIFLFIEKLFYSLLFFAYIRSTSFPTDRCCKET